MALELRAVDWLRARKTAAVPAHQAHAQPYLPEAFPLRPKPLPKSSQDRMQHGKGNTRQAREGEGNPGQMLPPSGRQTQKPPEERKSFAHHYQSVHQNPPTTQNTHPKISQHKDILPFSPPSVFSFSAPRSEVLLFPYQSIDHANYDTASVKEYPPLSRRGSSPSQIEIFFLNINGIGHTDIA